ncbi:MAG: hypothetical protein ATN36_02620 [Epulopiscium sp. Nele67-Bin005]|nr:MAG: hypothetical protein ATN36_02620 [Epulopiscium sp. Nele67-Bin005]
MEKDTIFLEEEQYLERVISFLKEEIGATGDLIYKQKNLLVDIRKEMWNEGMSAVDDVERGIDISQYLNMEAIETSQYKHQVSNLTKCQRLLPSPYFGRCDFKEEDEDTEQIYIGYHNLMDDDTYEVLVYDWRAPISSVYYNNDLGYAAYTAPVGKIEGELLLKRQYSIEQSKLKYYFNSNIAITDNILQEALGKNASHQMKNIVETIQQEQNTIIRNQDNDLLIVQGVAGSGKTSIAMHRIAFLLYNEKDVGVGHKDVIIISPNTLFGDYISSVLPELGEENVKSTTLEDLFEETFNHRLHMETRNKQLEHIIGSSKREKWRKFIDFKGSHDFMKILDRYLLWLEKNIKFEDIYYNKNLVMTKEELIKHFMDNPINLSPLQRLNRIKTIVLKKIKPLEAEYKEQIQQELEDAGGFDFEEHLEAKRRVQEYFGEFLNKIERFLIPNYLNIYINLVSDIKFFEKFTDGIKLPPQITHMLSSTHNRLKNRHITYEDGAILLYLNLRISDKTPYIAIKQVIIDEAQDYYPIHYHIFKMIFRKAHYTVLGDYCQTIEKKAGEEVYDDIVNILDANSALKLQLTKGYRSSYEISEFGAKLRGDTKPVVAFERHEEPPEVIEISCIDEMDNAIVAQIKKYQEEGFESIAILCKNKPEVRNLHAKIKTHIDINAITEDNIVLKKGVTMMPSYMAKGLEYDAVIIYQTNDENYNNIFDKQLLYIACSRALHRLSLFYTGQISRYL